MKTINTIKEIRRLRGNVYVRWSKSINLDNKRGYSLAYGTQAEAGLSVCKIDTNWEDWRILRQLQEYQFCGGSCWLVTGDEVGRGQDNEELLSNVECIGKVSSKLTGADYLIAWRDLKISQEKAKLPRITDAIGKRIVQEFISKLETSDRITLTRIMYSGS